MVGAVEACREIAEEVWRGDRWPPIRGHTGLRSEQAVRDRLISIAAPLERTTAPHTAALLHRIRSAVADPLGVLEATELALSASVPNPLPTAGAILEAPGVENTALIELLIVQAIAGRLGRWAVRQPELPDSRIGRALVRDIGPNEHSHLTSMLEVGRDLYRGGDFERAALCFLDADRIVRSPHALYHASIALWRAGQLIAALWCIRVALLEDPQTFEPIGLFAQAIRTESSLRRSVEGRGALTQADFRCAQALTLELGRGEPRPPARPTLLPY